MSNRIRFAAVPESFGDASGVLVLPDGDDAAPGIVLLQEYWGLNEHILSLAERWAKEGFVVVAPDLYRGRITSTAAEAGKLMASLDRERALADTAGAVAVLRAHPRCTGKIGVTGYCMGGAYAFAAAAGLAGLAAVVPFYGLPPSADWSQVTAPIQAHFSASDQWAKPAVAKQIQERLEAEGKSMELYTYEAPHAFCNDTRSDVYTPDAAALAWQRAVAFMRQHLGG